MMTDSRPVKRYALGDDALNPFLFADGSPVQTRADWPRRQAELSELYQREMYGVWRDGSDETLAYSMEGSTLTVTVTRNSTGVSGSFTATVQKPDPAIPAPEGGYPVLIGMHGHISEERALERGYAAMIMDINIFGPNPIASDDVKREGLFYRLYPYDPADPASQTGVLMAWGWGCSKLIDALEAGLGSELNISPVNTILTGVSRWGKAAMVGGAFDKRVRLVAPACSGAGGAALYRYVSEGRTYDLTAVDAPADYTYTKNEPLESLQADSERGWFNDRFMDYGEIDLLPVEQHLLAGLAADPDRYLMIIAACTGEDWVNAPAMWYTYLGAKQLYAGLGLEDHAIVQMHKVGHAVLPEDIDVMTAYFDHMVYGKPLDLAPLQTCVFGLPQNSDPAMADAFRGWTAPQA